MKTLIHTIVALAFFIQALIPMGFMPNAYASSEGTALVICSGLDVKTIYVDEHGEQLPSHKKTESEKPCLYSGLTVFKSTPLFYVVPEAVSYATINEDIFLSQIVALNKFLKPPAIGPPNLL